MTRSPNGLDTFMGDRDINRNQEGVEAIHGASFPVTWLREADRGLVPSGPGLAFLQNSTLFQRSY